MKSKKLLVFLMVAVMMANILSGCGESKTEAPTDTTPTDTENAWPERDITLTVGFAAGGDCDTATRFLADALTKELGVNVVVVDMAGSNGGIATEEINATSDPEYNFLVMLSGSLAGNPVTGVTELSYKDFEPICSFGNYSGETLYVAADAPYDTFEEFVEYAKTNTVKMGVAMGGSLYMTCAALKDVAGLDGLELLDAGDGVNRMLAILGGTIDCTFASYSSGRDYIENGDFKQIATLCVDRIAAAPDMPCVAETYPSVNMYHRFAILAKGGTDPAICQKFNDAIQSVYANDPEYVKNMEDYTFQSAKPMTIEETLADMEAQYETFQGMAKYVA